MIHIIGAGPAGISLAYYSIKAGAKEVRLYERTSKIGGMARSWTHHDFILDTGPHIFHTDDEEIASDDSELSSSELKIPEGWTPEQYRLWLEGEMPEGWTLVQWVLFSDEQLELLAEQ